MVLSVIGVLVTGCTPAAGDPGKVADRASPSSAAAASDSQVDATYADAWVGTLSAGASAVPFVYTPSDGKVDFDRSARISSGALSPMQLSPDKRWMIDRQDQTRVVIGALPDMVPSKVIDLSAVPLRNPDWSIRGATFGSDKGAELYVLTSNSRNGFSDPKLTETFVQTNAKQYEVWGINTESEHVTPKLVREFTQQAAQEGDSQIRFDPVNAKLVPYPSLTGFRFNGASSDGVVTLPSGAQIRLDAKPGLESTTLRTWYRKASSAPWEHVGKPATIPVLGELCVLSYPNGLTEGR